MFTEIIPTGILCTVHVYRIMHVQYTVDDTLVFIASMIVY